MSRRTFIILLFLLNIISFSCQTQNQTQNQTQTNTEVSNYQTITDEIGRKVKVVKTPQRIISLAPSITEILFSLGLGSKVVGVTSYCNYPKEAANIAKVSDTLHPNLEMIISLKPDLVLVSTASQLEQFTAKLSEVGIPVFVIKSQSVIGVINSIELVGQVTNSVEQATKLTDSLKARLEKVIQENNSKSRPKIFFIVGTEPLITAGRNAFITDLINLAGGTSISADVETEWPAYSIETVIARSPDIILSPGSHVDGESSNTALPKGLAATPAVKKQQTYQIDGDLILRPGPRIIDGLEQMSKIFHPEK